MRFVILLLVLGIVLALILPLLRRPAVVRARRAPSALDDELVKDPVCQTYVVRSRAVSGGGDGAPYFCSTACARRYAG